MNNSKKISFDLFFRFYPQGYIATWIFSFFNIMICLLSYVPLILSASIALLTSILLMKCLRWLVSELFLYAWSLKKQSGKETQKQSVSILAFSGLGVLLIYFWSIMLMLHTHSRLIIVISFVPFCGALLITLPWHYFRGRFLDKEFWQEIDAMLHSVSSGEN